MKNRKGRVKSHSAADKSRRSHLQLLNFKPGRMRLPVNRCADILVARRVGAQFAARLEFSSAEIAVIATIVSEVTRGIIDRGEAGNITFTILENGDRHGLEIVARHEAALPPVSSKEEYADQKNAITMTLKKWRIS